MFDGANFIIYIHVYIYIYITVHIYMNTVIFIYKKIERSWMVNCLMYISSSKRYCR